MSVLGARARAKFGAWCSRSCSGEIWRLMLALVPGKIELLTACFFKVLEHRAHTEH
jgi:hypothetical protein